MTEPSSSFGHLQSLAITEGFLLTQPEDAGLIALGPERSEELSQRLSTQVSVFLLSKAAQSAIEELGLSEFLTTGCVRRIQSDVSLLLHGRVRALCLSDVQTKVLSSWLEDCSTCASPDVDDGADWEEHMAQRAVEIEAFMERGRQSPKPACQACQSSLMRSGRKPHSDGLIIGMEHGLTTLEACRSQTSSESSMTCCGDCMVEQDRRGGKSLTVLHWIKTSLLQVTAPRKSSNDRKGVQNVGYFVQARGYFTQKFGRFVQNRRIG
ncbi:hypothetical protein [Acetobacter aceti]|uniref:hypothetical protein n=1 Tax=Acetobacter aceti TaxID=435 RepID=UPI001656D606|nr:hypothetical protein [Acetobacter aceti]